MKSAMAFHISGVLEYMRKEPQSEISANWLNAKNKLVGAFLNTLTSIWK
jgi:hypothetical protein